MRFLHYILLISITALFSCTAQIIIPQPGAAANGKAVIEWNASRKLTWEDFSGTPSGDLMHHAAVTNCGFGYSSNKVTAFKKPVLTVTNVFNPNLSWVQPSQINRRQLLEHEQLHFDIAELYARRLRKEFSTSRITYTNLKRKTESIFDKVYQDYLKRQEAYEKETDYSLNTQNQLEWRRTIDAELTDLNIYSKEF